MNPVSELLRGARERIATPDKWTHVEGARNARGYSVYPESDEAVCWCMAGAIWAQGCAFESDRLRAFRLLGSANGIDVLLFNDAPTTTHADVLAVFDKAIAASEGNPTC